MNYEQEIGLIINKIKHLITNSKDWGKYRDILDISVYPFSDDEWDIKVTKKEILKHKNERKKSSGVNLKRLVTNILNKYKEQIAQEINGEVGDEE